MLTVGDLRQATDGLSDDTPVTLSFDSLYDNVLDATEDFRPVGAHRDPLKSALVLTLSDDFDDEDDLEDDEEDEEDDDEYEEDELDYEGDDEDDDEEDVILDPDADLEAEDAERS